MLLRLVTLIDGISGLPKRRPGLYFSGRAFSVHAQGAIEYIVILATLALIVAGASGLMPFEGSFMTTIRGILEEFFAGAVGKMVPQ